MSASPAARRIQFSTTTSPCAKRASPASPRPIGSRSSASSDSRAPYFAAMFFPTTKRDARRILLVEFNPHQILVATLTQQRGGRTVVEAAAEFDRDDTAGFREWL